MIEAAPQLIAAEFARLDEQIIAPFRGRQTAQVVDALGGKGALDYRIKPMFADQSALCGTALTCHAGAADNYGVAAALDRSQPGDIIICSTNRHMDCAVVGDLVMGMCRNAGIAGFVTDGAVRDTRGIREAGLPCFAAGVSPNSPAMNGPATVGMPIVLGGLSVNAGDLIVADEDGVVVVPADRIQETTDTLAKVLDAEAARLEEVRQGRRTMLG
jgi:4-hydroxy-4-methyl-2-oxoglutarate aldolase